MASCTRCARGLERGRHARQQLRLDFGASVGVQHARPASHPAALPPAPAPPQTPFYDALRVTPAMPVAGHIKKRDVPKINNPAEALLT